MKSDASIGLVNDEKNSAIATTIATSTPISSSAAPCVAVSGASDNQEIPAKPMLITTIWSQIVSSSPAYLPSRNSLREIGFDRIVKMVRRSTSRCTRPMPTKIAIATAKTRIAAKPTSWRIRSLST